jgi:ArsR family transcriptional regulator, arsenate/arsenite/antimonite-responsive transcriptional repressor
MKSTQVVAALGALAQETRLTIFRELVKRGPGGYTPGELSEKLDIPAPTLSFHLKELLRTHLVSARREGRFLHYSANFDVMQDLIGFLTEKCCVLANEDCATSCAPPATSGKRRTA